MQDADGGPIMTADREHSATRPPSIFRRGRERIARYRALHITWQITVLTIGIAIVCAGLAMLVLPGPGWAAIFVGLAVLSTEFMWAERLLAWTKRQARQAANRALDPRHRRRNQALLAVVVVGTVLGSWWYVTTYGWPAPMQWLADLF
ncbi:MAG TPA: TIGR02611 family protein [Jiangellaceae bacterium]|jgi:uncharacterized protein (TIGR02611 family)|nr:TIGR02611 family protein [Jiangellaceae bacterium]